MARNTKKLWQNAREDAQAQIKRDVDFNIIGSDRNQRSLETAKKNADLAGLKTIHFEQRQLIDVKPHGENGKIICNPPYGQRLGNEEDIKLLYQDMGQLFFEQFPDWTYYVLTAHEEFESLFGKKSRKHRKLYNGGIKCFFYQYFDY